MKTLLILTIFISTNSIGQNLFNTYKGTWINERQEVVMIKDTVNEEYNLKNRLSNNKSYDFMFGFSYHIDTLFFYNKYYNDRGSNSDLYSFKVTEVTDSFLNLKPLSSFAKECFSNSESVKFIKQEYASDASINFEKLVYNLSSDCFPGPCSGIYVEINNKKEIYLDVLFYKKLFEKDDKNSGSFKAILPDSLYKELIHLIQTCHLANLYFPSVDGNDGQIVDLIIQYNGKEKHLRSMFPPLIIHRLMNFLDVINTKVSLTRVPQKKKLVE